MKQVEKIIDINCDLGEGNSLQDSAKDALLMPYISSCNIACGGHAGNETTMRQTLLNAKKYRLKIGAHPAYPDKDNFGRSQFKIPVEKLLQSILQQVSSLSQIAQNAGLKLHHIKFHGALYNELATDAKLAQLLAEFIAKNLPAIKIVGLASGEFEKACLLSKIDFLAEGFMDRVYLPSGKLSPRTDPDAVMENVEQCVAQACDLALRHVVKTADGTKIHMQVKTICLHGDNKNALLIAQQLSSHLSRAGIAVQ